MRHAARVCLLVFAVTAIWFASRADWGIPTVRAQDEGQDLQGGTKTPDVIYVPTPQEVVDKMLELAEIQKGDVLYDLGCGDGRIVVTAAKKYGVKAIGFDIDPQRIKESQANVREERRGRPGDDQAGGHLQGGPERGERRDPLPAAEPQRPAHAAAAPSSSPARASSPTPST